VALNIAKNHGAMRHQTPKCGDVDANPASPQPVDAAEHKMDDDENDENDENTNPNEVPELEEPEIEEEHARIQITDVQIASQFEAVIRNAQFGDEHDNMDPYYLE
jgi:hypothetical protein